VFWLQTQTTERVVRGVACYPRDCTLQPVGRSILADGSMAKEREITAIQMWAAVRKPSSNGDQLHKEIW